jgi:1,4-alpha-glucan branching enzyme
MSSLSAELRLVLSAVLATFLAATIGCAARTPPEAPVMTRSGVRFSLVRPDARTVALAGSFNEWSPVSHLLSRQASGAWTIVVGLPPGEHPFMFVVDGQWVSPPVADDYADDGFGKRNGIVVVRPNES